MPLHDVNYKHWEGIHLGVWSRRWAIAKNGLTACLKVRWMTYLVVSFWVPALVVTAFLFMIGQFLVADSVAIQWISAINPKMTLFAGLFTSWLADHPEISVGTVQNVLFYYLCIWLTRASIFALGPIIPLLITRDLASNAIVIYSSKAVSRGDYLLGKFATAFGFLTLTWLGPVCAAWFLGNLLAPHWMFFWHARGVLGNILIYGLSSMTVLSLLALGVSALSTKEKVTTFIWFMWWILGTFTATLARHTQPWLGYLSFGSNLHQIALRTFRVGDNLKSAQDTIPVLGDILQMPQSTQSALETPHIAGTCLALLVMLSLAAWIVHQRVKPE